MVRIASVIFAAFLLNSFKAASQLHLKPVKDSIPYTKNLRVLPQNFYNQNLGFFCKKEVQLQKLTSLPIYFRLGTKEYVDRLERKPNRQ
jgi:hypothetical protein